MTSQQFDERVKELRGKVEPRHRGNLKKYHCSPEAWAAYLDHQAMRRAGKKKPRSCSMCGGQASGKRYKYCDPCFRKARVQQSLAARGRKGAAAYATQMRDRRAGDPAFRLASQLRCRLRSAVRVRRVSASVSAVADSGMTAPELRRWIESRWQPGMTWDNYGQWSIDHIYPLLAPGLDLTVRENALAVCNYRNLRPVWQAENNGKGNAVTAEARALFEELRNEFRPQPS